MASPFDINAEDKSRAANVICIVVFMRGFSSFNANTVPHYPKAKNVVGEAY
jgi:hypothetical protein